jgi:hypothetical protein
MLARELVDGVRAQIEDLRDLFAVQMDVVPVEHRSRSTSAMVGWQGVYHAIKNRVKNPAGAIAVN